MISVPVSSRELGKLTPGECEVARLAASGRSNAEIGEVRGTSPRTVANQIASILSKLGLASRHELAARYFGRRGFKGS